MDEIIPEWEFGKPNGELLRLRVELVEVAGHHLDAAATGGVLLVERLQRDLARFGA